MLVYIRKEEVPTILSDVTTDKIPVSLSQRFTDEREIENIKRKEKNEAHLYVSVTVITDEQFNGHQGKVRALGNSNPDAVLHVGTKMKDSPNRTISVGPL